METSKSKENVQYDNQEIIVSQAIKAGKRIYYLDIKKSRKGEMFLAITESKKVLNGEDYTYEKHKIFLYKEVLDKFQDALGKAIAFIKASEAEPLAGSGSTPETGLLPEDKEESSILHLDEKELNIDIDF